jgi:DNA polymerase
MGDILTLEDLEKEAAKCTLCGLNVTRTRPVFARGNPKARIMICGMVPGPDEDKVGTPFVGRAGQLLDKILDNVDIDRDSVYITNLVKCWLKPGLPLKREWIGTCLQYIIVQILLVSPRIVITLGKDASTTLLGLPPDTKMADIRGGVYNYTTLEMGPKIEILPTYHPSYLLRGGGEKSPDFGKVLEDFKLSKTLIGG